ncbi:hypothetical protein Tco_0712707 [Tanacetum coccineum]
MVTNKPREHDHAGCNDDCKITSRGIQFLGGKLVSWSSKKQDYTTTSSAEAKYVSLSACCAQVIWMRTQLLDYGFHYHKILIYCDLKSAIAISCNPIQHSRTKHINIRYHFIKDHVEKGTIELYFVETKYQLADLFTKALRKERFEFLVYKILFHMAQHVILAAQLVPQYKPIERCNNYTLLQSIPCSPECKIVGLILLDHCISHAQTATADVLAVDTLHLPVETPENPFVAPANIHTIEAFMNKVGYQGVVDKLIVADLMKKFPNIPKRLEEDYHSIKDDVPLVSVYTMGNVLVRWMLILDAFLTAEIRETDDFKEYETVFMKESKKRKQTAGESSSRRIIIKKKKQNTPSIPPPRDDRERDEMAEATILSLTLHKTALDAEAKENIAKVEKEKEVVEIVKDTNVDDTSAKKNNEVVTEKEVVDMLDKTILEELADTVTPTTATSSKTPSTTTRHKKSFTPKTRRLPGSIAGMCKRLIRSHIKTKFITREFFVEKIKEVIQHCDKIVPELTVTMTNEMLKKERPCLVKLAVNKDREVSPVDISGMVSKEFATHGPKLIEELFRKHMQNTTLNLYPKTKSSTATTSSADLQQQLHLSMKTKPQDQAADPEIWEILKAKFEKL